MTEICYLFNMPYVNVIIFVMLFTMLNLDILPDHLVLYIILYFSIYGVIQDIYHNYKHREAIAAYAVSMIACWNFVINGDYKILEAYYWYDIMISLYKRDALMVAHHFLVIYVLYRTGTPDSHIGIILLKCSKYSDIFCNINKFLQLSKPNSNLIKDIRLLSTLITIVLWMIFRIGVIAYVSNKVELYESKLVLAVFGGFNVWWIYKLCGLAYRLAYYE